MLDVSLVGIALSTYSNSKWYGSKMHTVKGIKMDHILEFFNIFFGTLQKQYTDDLSHFVFGEEKHYFASKQVIYFCTLGFLQFTSFSVCAEL